MRNIIFSILGLIWFGAVPLDAEPSINPDSSQLFQFRFSLNHPLVYAVEIKNTDTSDVQAGQRASMTRGTSDFRYKIKLTGTKTNQDGTTTVNFVPFDFESDSQTQSPNGEIENITRGLDIVTKHNGIVVVDTAKKIGGSQMQTMKQSIYPFLLSGYFDFDPTGHIKKIDGDLPFIETWENNLKYGMGLFYIEFPKRPLSIQESWTNNITKDIEGGMTLSDAIVQPWVFTRQPDQFATNGQATCFALYESDYEKDLGGFIDQQGQRNNVIFPEINESVHATYEFDQKRGLLLSMKLSNSKQSDLKTVYQGNSSTGHYDNRKDLTIKLISQ